MAHVVVDTSDLFALQTLERRLFRLDAFVPSRAVFPDQVFRRRFDAYRFLPFNDWYAAALDHARLLRFLRTVGDDTFYASCPPHFMVRPVACSTADSPGEFSRGFRHQLFGAPDNHGNEIGLAVSGQTFLFSRSVHWAEVHDITHDVIIVGLSDPVRSAWELAFQGDCYDVNGAINRLNQMHAGISVSDAVMQKLRRNYPAGRITPAGEA